MYTARDCASAPLSKHTRWVHVLRSCFNAQPYKLSRWNSAPLLRNAPRQPRSTPPHNVCLSVTPESPALLELGPLMWHTNPQQFRTCPSRHPIAVSSTHTTKPASGDRAFSVKTVSLTPPIGRVSLSYQPEKLLLSSVPFLDSQGRLRAVQLRAAM